jgi:hypothetical protein
MLAAVNRAVRDFAAVLAGIGFGLSAGTNWANL